MKDYFSVGEVCKIKDISVGSLRYYEELGVLCPVYVSPSNGYRYYSHQQMLQLDVIITCIDLDIPLKDVKQYFSEEGHINFAAIQKMGEDIAEKKMQKIKGHLEMFRFWTKHGEETEEILRQSKFGIPCIKQEKKRYFYCLPYENEVFCLGEYEKIHGALIKDLREQQVGIGYEEGLFFKKVRGKVRCYVFCQVNKGILGKTMTVPSGSYRSDFIRGSEKLMIELHDLTEKNDIAVGRFLFHHQFEPEHQYFALERRILEKNEKKF